MKRCDSLVDDNRIKLGKGEEGVPDGRGDGSEIVNSVFKLGGGDPRENTWLFNMESAALDVGVAISVNATSLIYTVIVTDDWIRRSQQDVSPDDKSAWQGKGRHEVVCSQIRVMRSETLRPMPEAAATILLIIV
jgi:hypothetical protein